MKKAHVRRQNLIPPRSVVAKMKGVPLNTARAADVLRVSTTEIKRRAKHEIIPSVIDEHGRWWFDESVLFAIVKQQEEDALTRDQEEEAKAKAPRMIFGGARKVGPAPDRLSGPIAAKIFKSLMGGKSVQEIVVEHEILPLVVLEGMNQFALTGGGMFFQPELLAKVAAELGETLGAKSFATPEDVLQRLVLRLNMLACTTCSRRALDMVCLACASAKEPLSADT